MAKKKSSSRPKAEILDPQVRVEKTITNQRVDDIGQEIRELTYGQCLVLKVELDRRLALTRARKR